MSTTTERPIADALTAIKTRRSVKEYLPTEIPREWIEELLDAAHWALDDSVMDRIADALDAAPRVTLFSEAEIAAFTKVDRRQFEANLAGAVPEGLRKPAHE